MSTAKRQDFNDILCSAIEDTISDALGRGGLEGLYKYLKDHHEISRDELPYRIETMYSALEAPFGIFGAKTIGIRIARNFYAKLRLTFYEHEGYALQDYIETAKSKLTNSN